MKTLTVITTTYNRAYCIETLYKSLLRQTSGDFVWLVVDDGSTDNTEEKIRSFIAENKIEIEYIHQKNAGMHGARNTAYDNVKTELNVIIDDDDYMTDDAVEIIVDFWAKNKRDDLYGIITLNKDLNGNVVGTPIPDYLKETKSVDLAQKHKVKGDKKLVLRSDLSKLYPFPIFEGEKFFPASYKYILLDRDYSLIICPKATCIVDCNQNSMTYNKVKQYLSCPKGFAFYRNTCLKFLKSPKLIIKETLHYIAESKLAGDKHYVKNSSRRFYTVLCLPFGIALYYYIKKTKKKAIGV